MRAEGIILVKVLVTGLGLAAVVFGLLVTIWGFIGVGFCGEPVGCYSLIVLPVVAAGTGLMIAGGLAIAFCVLRVRRRTA